MNDFKTGPKSLLVLNESPSQSKYRAPNRSPFVYTQKEWVEPLKE